MNRVSRFYKSVGFDDMDYGVGRNSSVLNVFGSLIFIGGMFCFYFYFIFYSEKKCIKYLINEVDNLSIIVIKIYNNMKCILFRVI